MLSWETYARGLQERFGSSNFTDPMTELETLKQQGTVDLFHGQFLVVGSHNELGVEAITLPTKEFQDYPEQLENTEPEAETNPPFSHYMPYKDPKDTT
ncbi:hypothetical protein PVK06_002745 [Gossypium arboreum]|uniref:Retrotransposon gag domain-containing protein n=1 Tax=Gossypium arboreum TaxID=29729 RepID=A0ABR0R4M2_GOSAR|nr:hypothetical protein PVK06_002745 [Gossypium arboreum]